MSKKDYIVFAQMIKNRREEILSKEEYKESLGMKTLQYTRLLETKVIANEMAKIFAADNSSFNRRRFLVACGIEE